MVPIIVIAVIVEVDVTLCRRIRGQHGIQVGLGLVVIGFDIVGEQRCRHIPAQLVTDTAGGQTIDAQVIVARPVATQGNSVHGRGAARAYRPVKIVELGAAPVVHIHPDVACRRGLGSQDHVQHAVPRGLDVVPIRVIPVVVEVDVTLCRGALGQQGVGIRIGLAVIGFQVVREERGGQAHGEGVGVAHAAVGPVGPDIIGAFARTYPIRAHAGGNAVQPGGVVEVGDLAAAAVVHVQAQQRRAGTRVGRVGVEGELAIRQQVQAEEVVACARAARCPTHVAVHGGAQGDRVRVGDVVVRLTLRLRPRT